MRPGAVNRFSKAMNASAVQFLTLKGNHFVLLNSMAMEGDTCAFCTEARRRIENISSNSLIVYLFIIILQHFSNKKTMQLQHVSKACV